MGNADETSTGLVTDLKHMNLKYRSSHSGVFCGKVVLKTFANFIGKHLCCNLFTILLKSDSDGDFFLQI